MKVLNGQELAGFIKERQYQVVRGMSKKPCLVIIRDSDNPVIMKYVTLKQQYGEDIGVEVRDVLAHGADGIKAAILEANADADVNGIILQLPIIDRGKTDELTALIAPEKDVDGLSANGSFDSATATAINWLLGGYNIDLAGKKIALVGYGKLVGAPLYKMWTNSGFDVTVFRRGDDLAPLADFDVIVTATGTPHLIKNELVRGGAVVVDAGTASEDGVLVGDLDEAVRERQDLAAITPRIGGVGPLTVGCLFEHVINA
ncbi:bifunctional 5,10-methylenetetrahydrofolate dehydrogenase/5,10-methenyltetrahydrofolate cyclohydrolase [Candidatus Saccharibacteria bacterium]|nr:bifunctional 5,10-methylenetetrahydrofolate dehydrogenase/5,10-methenyltetrahydrofolate cyclohydrolase [Candidatus Saccharibacteria bacterium]